jgi:hypothetical protein
VQPKAGAAAGIGGKLSQVESEIEVSMAEGAYTWNRHVHMAILFVIVCQQDCNAITNLPAVVMVVVVKLVGSTPIQEGVD